MGSRAAGPVSEGPTGRSSRVEDSDGSSAISYPGAEVIALSPKTLLATSRFVCQVCGKGFQREQNLQLHRRGHNLPWNLKRKSPDERRRVYLCPEPTCAHHDPSRALGDLTGVKKHYCRKHGEKRWKCDQCSRRYAVLSDWKAHAKICGTREYRCHCGILFSRSTPQYYFHSIHYIAATYYCRRDSYITHRAFCDALAQENARLPPVTGISGHLYANKGVSYLGLPQFNSHLPAAGGSTNTHEQSFNVDAPHLDTASFRPLLRSSHGQPYLAGEGRYDDLHGFNFGASSSSGNNYFNKNLNFFPTAGKNEEDQSGGGHLVGPAPGGGNDATAMSLLLASEIMGHQEVAGFNMSMTPSLYGPGPPLPQLSAAVMLRKAAQLGDTSSFTGIGGGPLRSNERQYQKTMNSLGGGEFASDHLMAAGGFRLAMQPDDVEKEKLSTRNFLASAAP
ncbi:hypothetical protein ZIOFF_011955 [Zingiber officinale]|uniref:C2H2-type domain-containing protein n=1 Tax=Zingiber officinale TaxID=94328 RepID=A0A8J5LL56_ZINOF|nr:hypothetical protein ZIOFF_011955 [Zingiber officinale]